MGVEGLNARVPVRRLLIVKETLLATVCTEIGENGPLVLIRHVEAPVPKPGHGKQGDYKLWRHRYKTTGADNKVVIRHKNLGARNKVIIT